MHAEDRLWINKKTMESVIDLPLEFPPCPQLEDGNANISGFSLNGTNFTDSPNMTFPCWDFTKFIHKDTFKKVMNELKMCEDMDYECEEELGMRPRL